MKTLIQIAFLTSCVILLLQERTAPNWLIGNWRNIKSGTIETWGIQGDSTIGKAFKIENGDTVVLEQLSIVTLDEKLYYVADVPENDKPIYFEITRVDENEFYAENLAHDFPKRITYIYQNDSLRVNISDESRSIKFNFARIK